MTSECRMVECPDCGEEHEVEIETEVTFIESTGY